MISKKFLISVLFMAPALFLCSCSNNAADSADSDSEAASPICIHDETYTEPAVKTGKYYLNGDINSYYWNVTADTVELCGIDPGELSDSWQSYGSDPASDGADEDIVQMRIEERSKFVERWSGPQKYTVKTLHEINDQVTLVTREVTSPDGFVISTGLILKDENTITGFGKDGNFILVE